MSIFGGTIVHLRARHKKQKGFIGVAVITSVLVTAVAITLIQAMSPTFELNPSRAISYLTSHGYYVYGASNPYYAYDWLPNADNTLDIGSETYSWADAYFDGTIYGATGRTATSVVAASNSIATSIAQADYVCDGVDDQVQIQAAMNALPSGGGRVLLSKGTFNLSSAISWPENSGITLEGQGILSTRLLVVSGADCNAIEYTQATLVYFATIENLMIQGNTSNASGYGIYIDDNFVDYRMEDVYVTLCKQDGIYLGSGWTSSVINCVSESNSGNGMTFESNTVIIGGFYSYNVNGIMCSGAAQSQIIATECYDNSASGIYANTLSDAVISFNTLRNNDKGLYAQNCYDIEISGNSIHDNPTYGIHLRSSGGTNTGIRIISNAIDNSGTGLFLQAQNSTQLRNVIFAYNELKDNTTVYTNSGNATPIETWQVEHNVGLIFPGEERSVYGTLAAGNANGICFAWNNPEAQDILIKKIVIEITIAGGTVGAHLDIGIADDATGTNRGTEFFDDLLLNNIQIDDSWSAGDGGTQTKWVFCQDQASAIDDWIVGQILDANAASLVGKFYIEYVGR